MNGSVPYEFGTDRPKEIQTGDIILQGTLTTAALFWQQFALLHIDADADLLTSLGLRKLHADTAASLRAMADAIEQHLPAQTTEAELAVSSATLADPRFGEYARNTAARFEELKYFSTSLAANSKP